MTFRGDKIRTVIRHLVLGFIFIITFISSVVHVTTNVTNGYEPLFLDEIMSQNSGDVFMQAEALNN